MKCLRCGHCCMVYAVVIVLDPDKGVKEDNLVCRDGSERCPHLTGPGPGEYRCAVHDRSWYPRTPCAAHGQIERSPDDECRMGRYVLDHLQKEDR